MIKDIFVGDEDDAGYPQHTTAEGDKLVFTADDGTHGRELWVSDGSEEGTFMVKDINPGEEFGGINTGANHCPYSHLVNNEYYQSSCFIGSEGSVFFSADSDGSGGDSSTLWKSDGTENGTVEFEDVISPEYFNVLGNKVTFFARNGSYAALWETDGTEEGTVVIHDQVDGSWGHVVNDKLFFNGKPDPDSENTGSELWVSDGTGDGTYMVKDIYPDEHHGSVQPEGASFGDKYYFMANDGTNGTSLWVSDGTGDGTYMVKDVNPNTMVLWGQNLFGTGDELYFYEDGPSTVSYTHLTLPPNREV